MKFRETTLPGSYLIDLELREDERGFFARYFCAQEFSEKGLNSNWVQINTSASKEAGTLRGLHFQNAPHTEVKLVRCLQGAIWDVMVDLRQDSATFGKSFGTELSAHNRTMMYVPQGFAHGFISLTANSEILYLVSDYYTPHAEETLLWSDKDVSIAWPMPPYVVSEKDKLGKSLMQIIKERSDRNEHPII